jgi:hypothetical protein
MTPNEYVKIATSNRIAQLIASCTGLSTSLDIATCDIDDLPYEVPLSASVLRSIGLISMIASRARSLKKRIIRTDPDGRSHTTVEQQMHRIAAHLETAARLQLELSDLTMRIMAEAVYSGATDGDTLAMSQFNVIAAEATSASHDVAQVLEVLMDQLYDECRCSSCRPEYYPPFDGPYKTTTTTTVPSTPGGPSKKEEEHR